MKLGLKQGCILSPSLFNLYLNGLVTRMKMRGLGVEVDGLMVALLLYADDLTILEESEQDFQDMLIVQHKWTQAFDMSVDNIQHVGVVLMDLSKAFNAIPHGLLVTKLYTYGISKDACKMIRSYLINWMQRVKLDDVM